MPDHRGTERKPTAEERFPLADVFGRLLSSDSRSFVWFYKSADFCRSVIVGRQKKSKQATVQNPNEKKISGKKECVSSEKEGESRTPRSPYAASLYDSQCLSLRAVSVVYLSSLKSWISRRCVMRQIACGIRSSLQLLLMLLLLLLQ